MNKGVFSAFLFACQDLQIKALLWVFFYAFTGYSRKNWQNVYLVWGISSSKKYCQE